MNNAINTPSRSRLSFQPGEPVWSVGLMSGTSLDGIDAAFIKTDGVAVYELGPSVTLPYPSAFQQALRAVAGPDVPRDRWALLDDELTQRHAEAVDQLRQSHPHLVPQLIGFHGHTLWHRPPSAHNPRGATCQMGNGARLAQLTGCPVVYDFRTNDMREGGHGAPLVPIFHAALCQNVRECAAVVNIGGVANLTYVPHHAYQAPETLLAFDIGPGNALINDWMLARTGTPVDADGHCAAAGTVDAVLLESFMGHPALQIQPPRSFDRDVFQPTPEQRARLESLSIQDGAATLTAFTALSLVAATNWLPTLPQRWFVAGGGRHNKTLMHQWQEHLRRRQPTVSLESLERLNCDVNACEAYAFGFLAVRSVQGLPLSFPGTTGVPRPALGGVLAPETFKPETFH